MNDYIRKLGCKGAFSVLGTPMRDVVSGPIKHVCVEQVQSFSWCSSWGVPTARMAWLLRQIRLGKACASAHYLIEVRAQGRYFGGFVEKLPHVFIINRLST